MKPLLAALVLFSSCLGNAPSGSTGAPGSGLPTNLVLRAYDVPNDAAPQVRTVLRDLMWFGSDGKDSSKYVGRADVGVDGRLLVLASEGVQEGVKNLIASVGSHPPRPAPTVELTYWLVFGLPGKSDAKLAPALQEVGAALAEIEKTDGPQEFTLREKLTAQAISGELAALNGRDLQVRQTATASAQGITADLHFERFAQRFDTRVKLEPGQVVVLGSSGAALQREERDEPARALYYVVRAALHDGPGR